MTLAEELVVQLKPRSASHADVQKTIKLSSFQRNFSSTSPDELKATLGKLCDVGILRRIPKQNESLYCLKIEFGAARERAKQVT